MSQIKKFLKQVHGKMRTNTHLERLKNDIHRLIKTCKSFSKCLILLSLRVMWHLFPDFCRTNCLRILKVLWWFARRDSGLDADLNERI